MQGWRVARVAAGITIVSVFAGALAGVLGVALLLTATGGLRDALTDPEIYIIGAMIGGVCGIVVGPIGAFGFMRHVPLWRLFAETIVGAAIAGAGASLLPIDLFSIIGVAAAGFFTAGARLAWATHRGARRKALPTSVYGADVVER